MTHGTHQRSVRTSATKTLAGSRRRRYGFYLVAAFVLVLQLGGAVQAVPARAATDGATYVSEGAPADGTTFNSGANFAKRWTIRNSGTTVWSTGSYRATRVGGSYGPSTINLSGSVGAGSNTDITGNFTAPSSPGTYRATYQMQGPGGTFGQQFWVEIRVAAGGTDGATYVSEGAPADGTTFNSGANFAKRWTIRNSGTTVWSTGSYRATRVGGSYGPSTINLSGSVGAGSNTDITGNFTAPSSPGTYRATYQMQGPGGTFGQQFWVEIRVAAGGTDGATYVSEGAPADGTTFNSGANFAKRWTIRNSGTTVWSTGSYRATRVGGSYGPSTINLSGSVGAGSNTDITGNFTAPSSPGTYRATYQMQGPGGTFGQQFWVEIRVAAGGTDGATYVSEGAPADGTTFNSGANFAKRWTIRNSGTTVWSTGSYRATRVGGSYGPSTINLSGSVGAGSNTDITGNFTAPSSPGTYRATYQMQGPGGTFGQQFWVEIRVAAGGTCTNCPASGAFAYPVGNARADGGRDGAGWFEEQPFNVNYAYPDHPEWRHAGVDYQFSAGSQSGQATAGQPVYAVAAGRVVHSECRDYPGCVVILEHALPNGSKAYSMYGHIENRSQQGMTLNATFSRGQLVGTIISWPNNIGNSHLHFEVRSFLTRADVNGTNAPRQSDGNYVFRCGQCTSGPGYWIGDPRSVGWFDPIEFIRSSR